jgi:hypothetical protein
MADRIPNVYSPVEVRRAISRLRLDSDVNEATIDTIDERVTLLEEAAPDFYSGEAVEAIYAGMPLFGAYGSTSVGLARSDTQAKSRVVGIAKASASSGFAVDYLADGKLTLADWTTAAGSAALTPNAVYYLGEAGGITDVAPTLAGSCVVEVGRAVSGTILDVEIKRPVLL